MSTTTLKQTASADTLTGELDENALDQVNGGIIAVLISLAKSNARTYTVSGQGSGDPIPTESISFN